MKKFMLLALFFCYQISALAQEVVIPKAFEVNDIWGSIKLEFEENIEPIWHPLRMTLNLTCKDQRKNPTSVQPTEQKLVIHDRICEFRDHAFNEKEKILRLKYVVNAECDQEVTYSANLRTLCKAWGP